VRIRIGTDGDSGGWDNYNYLSNDHLVTGAANQLAAGTWVPSSAT
jgi:hypothetical protein